MRKSYPSYFFPNAKGPRSELDTFDHFEAKASHLDMHLWNKNDPSFSRMQQLMGEPHNGHAFQVSGVTSDRLTAWNLTFTKIPSIGSHCISKKAKINMMHPDFSWLSLVPAASVVGSIMHDNVTYNIDGFGSMEHVYGDMVQPALSWTYSFFHDGKSFMMLAQGRKHMERAANTFVVETEGRRFSFGPNEYEVHHKFRRGFEYPHLTRVFGYTDTELIQADIMCMGDSFASDAKRGAAEMRAQFNITICLRNNLTNCKIITQNGAGWSEYYSFSMLDRRYLPILHQIPYRLLLGFSQQLLRMEGWLVLLTLLLSRTGLRSSSKKKKML
uniref:Uncharacterized protein n=1 Tax=Percolomonas cosmopolitus TaxID=63605 RepID=A0A7S1PJ04_9EUKA|mmetsp:Transcript_8218/g.30343  ORF Transcript_8218/g.30343 Transcript_8218/m.30343 type:complete len:328 (+) Transcript_8218:233-1216(+)